MASILNPRGPVRGSVAIWLAFGLNACTAREPAGARAEAIAPEPPAPASPPAPAARPASPPPVEAATVGRAARVMGVSWSPDGRTLVAPLAEGGLEVWDLVRGTTRRTPGSHLAATVWRADGHLVIGDARLNGKGTILDDAEGTAVEIDSEDLDGVSFDPGASAVLGYGRIVGVWDAATGANRRVLWRPRRGDEGFELSRDGDWSPDGRLVAAQIGRWSARMVYPGRVTIWDAATGAVLRNLPMPAPAFEVLFSPDGRTLAVSDVDDHVSVWSPRSGRRLRTVEVHNNGSSLAWSPDGTALAVAPFDAHVVVWSIETGRVTRIPSDGGAWVRGAAWSPDGRVLAFAMEDQGLRLHRLADGAGLTLAGGHADPAALAALLRGAPEPRTRVEEGAPSPAVR